MITNLYYFYLIFNYIIYDFMYEVRKNIISNYVSNNNYCSGLTTSRCC